MAYQYDEFGNVIGEYESEEERRQREQQELADTAVHTQEIKTYGDGTKEVVTKQEIPPELQRQQDAYARTVAPVVAPVSPDQAAYTRQQESGGRSDIGYHFPANAQGQRQSTAFGPYGITEAAYKDIARQDPSLAKPITEWTPEEHDRAYNVLVGRNQARLTQLGIEPTAGALQLSHLLGPDGAARFLKTGEVSEAAARANGGAERLKQIAQGRFAGAPSASSGAAQTVTGPVNPNQPAPQAEPQPQPNSFDEFGTPMFSQAQADLDNHLSNYQEVQNNPDDLLNLSKDSTVPEWLKDRARNRAADLIIEQRKDAQAQKEAATMDENQIARLLRERKGEGSRLKGMLYAAFGLKDLANEELYKLGIGTDKTDSINGEPVIVKVAANGKAIDGINAVTGKDLTTKEIAEYNANIGSALGKGASVSAEVYVDKNTGKRYRSGVDSTGKAAMVDIQGGPAFKGNPKDLVVQSIGTAEAKAEAAKKISLSYDPIIAAATAGAKELGEANAKYGTNFAIVGYGPPGTPNAGKPILVDQTTNQIVTPDATGKVTVNQGATTVMPQGGTAALATGEKLRGERSSAMNKVLDEEVRPQAQAGDTVSSVRKQQFALFDRPGIDANKIFGLANASGEGVDAQKAAMLRDFLAGAVARNSDGTPMNGEQLSQRFAGLNLTPAEKSALAEYNIANQKINAATLKQTAGPGSVSNVEQQANRESNVDVTKIPALGAFNAMAQSQFDGDRARYKADWAAGQTFGSALEMDKAWRKENQRLAEVYANVAKERIKFINDNGNTYNAVREGYRRFPVPEYDPGTETWKKTKPLSSFNR